MVTSRDRHTYKVARMGEQECKKFSKELRVLDKETRAWDAYNGAENAVKNMMTSLRAVGELQNPSIRDRHWTQLMQATGVRTARPTQPPILVSRGGRVCYTATRPPIGQKCLGHAP